MIDDVLERQRRLALEGNAGAHLVNRAAIDEHPQPTPLEGGDELGEPGRISIPVELVPLVEPDHRICVPQHDRVVAAEVAPRGLQEDVRREDLACPVVQLLIPEPHERDREAGARPRERGSS